MLTTALTQMFGLLHPVMLAPMASVAGARLASAVSNAGGLGMLGGGYGDAAWLAAELAYMRAGTARPWGVGLITWSTTPDVLELVLSHRPAAVFLSFGDPRPHAAAIKAAGCSLVCQVQDVAQALTARDAGADLIVAQGSEAGGHGGTRGTFALVPAVVDAVAPLPVVAAGGIADGRGLAAALMLGAQGAMLGSRFYVTREAQIPLAAQQRVLAARGDDTARTHVFDIVRGLDWPTRYTGRALTNDFFQRWHGREEALRASAHDALARYEAARTAGDFDTAVVWAGEAIDLINTIETAATVVTRISDEGEALLRAVR